MAIQGGIDGDYDDRMTVVYLVILDDRAPQKRCLKVVPGCESDDIFPTILAGFQLFYLLWNAISDMGMKPTKEATGYFIGCSWGLLLV